MLVRSLVSKMLASVPVRILQLLSLDSGTREGRFPPIFILPGGRSLARSFFLEMWTEITLIERGPFVTEQIFSLQRPLPSLSLLLFSPLQGDFRLVDFYLNLICKKSPRVAIVIVVSLRARPLLNRRRRSRERRDGGRIISSHPRKLQKCRKWKHFMIHFALAGVH